MKSTFKFLASFLFAVALTACGGGGEKTTAVVIDPTTQPAAFLATDTAVGTGATAAAGDLLTVNYTGWLYKSGATGNKGTQFDTSAGRGPFPFTLGVGSVIPGWDQGVVGMKVGGKRTLTIPSSLGYGPTGSGTAIPANAGLVFDIELVSVKKPG